MKIKRKSRVWIFLILVFALLLRVYHLDGLELFGDELDVGYHAYSLLTTGRDYMGQRFPFYVHSFSEWRAPLLMYVTAPFVGVLGLNEWGVRLPVVVFGIANIFLLYVLTKELFKDEALSLLSAFTLAVVPWHIHYSRVAFEATLLLSLILLGSIGIVKGSRKIGKGEGSRWLWVGVISFALSFYTYNTANVFVPLWLLFLAFVLRDKVRNFFLKFVAYGLLFLVFVLPALFSVWNGQGAARFRLISIFNNPQTTDKIVFKRNTGIGSGRERIFHNKATGWGREFVGNYMTAFSPQFLFLTGDPNPRHNPPGFGQFYWLMTPFLFIGAWQLLKKKKSFPKNFIFAWLFLAPVPSSLTIGGGNQATRLFLILPPLVVLIAIGWQWFIDYFSRFKFLAFTLGFSVFIFSLFFWFHSYFVHYPKEQYRYWHYGYKEAFTWLASNQNNYRVVIINNSYQPSLLSFLFWTKKDPRWFQEKFNTDKVKKEIRPGFEGFWLGKKWLFGKVEISTRQEAFEWFLKNLDNKSVYLAIQGEEIPGNWNWDKEAPADFKVLKTVYNPWQQPLGYWITRR